MKTCYRKDTVSVNSEEMALSLSIDKLIVAFYKEFIFFRPNTMRAKNIVKA